MVVRNEKKYKGRKVNGEFPPIVIVTKSNDEVEADPKDLFKTIDEHNELEVNKKLDVAEQGAKKILSDSGLPLNLNELSSEQIVDTPSKQWFAYKILEKVERAREAMDAGRVVDAMFHSMGLFDYISKMTIKGVKDELSIGFLAKEIGRDSEVNTKEDKDEWVEIARKMLIEHTSDKRLSNKAIVRAILEKLYIDETKFSAIEKHIGSWRKTTEWKLTKRKK